MKTNKWLSILPLILLIVMCLPMMVSAEEDDEWTAYPEVQLSIDPEYQNQTGKTGKTISIYANWISEMAPKEARWYCSDSGATFSGTSFTSPDITGEENCWWLNVRMTLPDRAGTYDVYLSVDGFVTETKVIVEDDEGSQTHVWQYSCGEMQSIDNDNGTVKIDGRTYQPLSGSLSAADAQSALNAIIDSDCHEVIYSLMDNKLVHVQFVKEAIQPVVTIDTGSVPICWTGGKYLREEVPFTVKFAFKKRDTAIFDVNKVYLGLYADSIELSTDSDLFSFKKTSVFSSSKKCTAWEKGKAVENLTLILDSDREPSQALESASVNAEISISGWKNKLTVSDIVLQFANTDNQETAANQSTQNLMYNRQLKKMQDALNNSDRKSIITLDNELYNYFTKDQVNEIRDFLSVYMSEVLESDKVGELKCMSWMSEKNRKKVRSKILKTLGVNEKINVFKKGSASVSVSGTTIQGEEMKIDFDISYSEYAVGAETHPYAATGMISYKVNGKDCIGAIQFANLDVFRDIMMSFVEEAYNEAWGKNADSVAAMFVSEPINRLLKGSYSKRLYKLMRKNVEKSMKRVSVHCPVDVYVYNGSGQLCGAVENEVITRMQNIYITCYDENKDLYLSGDNYQIKVVNREPGYMSYDVEEFTDGKIVGKSSNDYIRLDTYGRVFNAYIPDTPNLEEEVYALYSPDGSVQKIEWDEQYHDQSENLSDYVVTGYCGEETNHTDDDVKYSYSETDHIMTISGKGPMESSFWQNTNYHTDVEGTIGDIERYADSNEGLLHHLEEPDCDYRLGSKAIHHIVIEDGVTTIGDFAFYNQPNMSAPAIQSIEIGDDVTKIGKYAFAGQQNLSSIYLGAGVQEIDGSAFWNCPNLKNIYVSPDNPYLCIGKDYGLYSNDYTELYRLPSEVTAYEGNSSLQTIRACAADHLPFLETVDLSNTSCQGIWNRAFGHCPNLKNVNLPESLSLLDDAVFIGCSNLSKVKIMSEYSSDTSDANHEPYKGIFADCPLLKELGPLGSNCNLEYGWTEQLPEFAFINMDELNSAIIYDGIENLDYRFRNCENLSHINIPDSVKSVTRSFEGCNSLRSLGKKGKGYNIEIEFTDSIPREAFAESTALEIVDIPEGISEMGSYAFASCENLESVIIPDSLRVFRIDEDLENSWYYGSDPDCAIFQDDPKLKTAGPLGGDYNIQLGWKHQIPKNAFNHSHLDSVTIPQGVTSIKEGAFYESFIKEVNIADSVEIIEDSAFMYSRDLTTVKMSKGLKKIGICAFYDCFSLESIALPGSLEEISRECFFECYSLKRATFSEGLKVIGQSAFYECKPLTNVVFPKSLERIGQLAFFRCFDLEEIIIPGNVATIEDSEEYYDEENDEFIYPYMSGAAFSQCSNLKKMTVLSKFWETSFEESMIHEDFTIYGLKDSRMQKVAEEYNIPFVAIDCFHSWTDWEIKIPATSVHVGYKQRICKWCGLKEGEEIPKPGTEPATQAEESTTAASSTTDKTSQGGTSGSKPGNSAVKKGNKYPLSGNTLTVTSVASGNTAGKATFTKSKNTKTVTIPNTVKLSDGKTYKVTTINPKAFTGKKIRKVVIGANVTKIAPAAFKGSKVTTVILKTKRLKKASVKGAFKGSKVKKVMVKVGSKKQNKKTLKTYKKIFTKANTGRKVVVK